jgi:ribosomal protein S6--L-glutamate ligase
MHFCCIVEARYQHEHMPLVVAKQLVHWGHTVDVLEPQTTITSLSHLVKANYDAFVLKTVSDGPGLRMSGQLSLQAVIMK